MFSVVSEFRYNRSIINTNYIIILFCIIFKKNLSYYSKTVFMSSEIQIVRTHF